MCFFFVPFSGRRFQNRRLVASLAQTRMDLERERQGAEDLRREIQSYVSHVRKVESILARKVQLSFSPLALHFTGPVDKVDSCVSTNLAGRGEGRAAQTVPGAVQRDEQLRRRAGTSGEDDSQPPAADVLAAVGAVRAAEEAGRAGDPLCPPAERRHRGGAPGGRPHAQDEHAGTRSEGQSRRQGALVVSSDMSFKIDLFKNGVLFPDETGTAACGSQRASAPTGEATGEIAVGSSPVGLDDAPGFVEALVAGSCFFGGQL